LPEENGLPKTLFERNLIALAEHVSLSFAESLATLQSDLALVKDEGTGLLNIAVGGRRMYPSGAEPFAARQVAEFVDNPQSLSLSPVMPPDDRSLISDRATRRLHNKFASKMDRQRRDPELLAGYLTMFGLGLGLQIEPMLQRFNVRHLIVADQTPAFLALSMQAIEWTDIIKIVKERGGRVQFLFDDDPMALSNKVYEAMRGPDRGLLDGSYVFGHYRTPVLEAALAQFMESARVIADSDGFFEDECLMLKHASDNLSARAHRILVPGASNRGCPPAVIIGSGPSIDGEIETLKRLRDKCLFISGGTGLGVLLESGIRPDFHCEIENVAAIITVNQMVADRYGTDGIHLIAASTVDPHVVGLFSQATLVMRDNLSPTRLFGREELVLPMAGPTVTHLACRTAMALGAPEIYLFGVDLGTVAPERHHSNASIYGLSDDPFWQSGGEMEKLTIPVAGNFQETAYTSREFAFGTLYFSTLASLNPAHRFFNCSDGVRIEGAAPKRSSSLDFPPCRVDPSALVAGLPVLTMNDTAINSAMAALGDEMSALAPSVAGLAGRQAAQDMQGLNDRLRDVLSGGEGGDPASTAKFMMSGTCHMILQAGNSLYGRVSPGRRREVVEETATALAKAAWEMAGS